MAANKKHNPRAGRAPAYQWYPGDALADEAMSTMDLAEEGAFRRLLDHHYREGSIPADPEELRRLCKWIPVKRFEAIWKRVGKCFAPDPMNSSRLLNTRAAEQRRLDNEYRAAASAGGIQTAANMTQEERTERARNAAKALHAGANAQAAEQADTKQTVSSDVLAPAKSAICDLRSASSDPAPTEQVGAVGALPAGEQKALKPKKPRNAKKAPKPDAEAAVPAPEPALDEELAKVPVDRCLDALASASGGRFVRPSSVSEIVRINLCHWLKGRTMRSVRTMGEWLAAGGWHWKGMLTIADVSTKDVFVSWIDLAATWDASGRGDPRAMGRPADSTNRPAGRPGGRPETEVERTMAERLARADEAKKHRPPIDWDSDLRDGEAAATPPAPPATLFTPPARVPFTPPGSNSGGA